MLFTERPSGEQRDETRGQRNRTSSSSILKRTATSLGAKYPIYSTVSEHQSSAEKGGIIRFDQQRREIFRLRNMTPNSSPLHLLDLNVDLEVLAAVLCAQLENSGPMLDWSCRRSILKSIIPTGQRKMSRSCGRDTRSIKTGASLLTLGSSIN